jgi:hypothetical protein
MWICHPAWLQLFRRLPGEEVLAEMDWGPLVLFVGLLVLAGSVRDTVLVETLQQVGSGLGWRDVRPAEPLSNVPAVVSLPMAVFDPTGWHLLAAVSTLAGNATPIASAATLMILDQASRRGVGLSVVHLIRPLVWVGRDEVVKRHGGMSSTHLYSPETGKNGREKGSVQELVARSLIILVCIWMWKTHPS